MATNDSSSSSLTQTNVIPQSGSIKNQQKVKFLVEKAEIPLQSQLDINNNDKSFGKIKYFKVLIYSYFKFLFLNLLKVLYYFEWTNND